MKVSSQTQLASPPPASVPQALTAEEEALKKNTDCVYFLASPLTCKKGAECEYRHSEETRMNPTDCYYWLSGNCLNPKCAFRHPPLDGLVGTSVKSSLPPSMPVASNQLSAANASGYNPVKQATPCYYFQKGLCLKGDRCAFMHGSRPVDRVAPQVPVQKSVTPVAPVTEPQSLKKPYWGAEKCTTQQKNFPQENVAKPVVVPPPMKPQFKAVAQPAENGIAVERSRPPIPLNNEPSRYKAVNVPFIISGNSDGRIQHVLQAQQLDDHRTFRNGKEPDEFLGESSPGFDVLVDDELNETEYYEKEDDFGRRSGPGGRNMNTGSETDYHRSADYSPVARFDREPYSDSWGYDTYDRAPDRYGREQRKSPSERVSDRPYMSERRRLPRVESPENIDELDLRHRLSKQRRTNGSRSVVSPDSRGSFYRRDDRGRHVEDQRYQSHTRSREPRYIPQESSISNRLQGRISIPRRSSPDRNQNDAYDKEMDRGRKLARLSPGRPSISSFPGRPQDRLRRRAEDEFDAEGRSIRAPFLRRDEADNNTLDFAAPKRLVELKKGGMISDRGERQQTRGKETSDDESKTQKIRKFDSRQEYEGSTSFEGPKPLKEILKRKREEKTAVSGDSFSGSAEGDNQKEREENSQTVSSEKQSDNPSDIKGAANDQYVSSKEEQKLPTATANGTVDEEEEEGLISEEAVEAQPSTQKQSEPETEDMIMPDAVEDEDYEASDHRDAESDYEQVDGEFKPEEDDNQDAEDEYFDDEDGDDFAKRIGVMFS